MSPITTHVLDTSKGKPAQGILAELEIAVSKNKWKLLGRGMTDQDGRIKDLLPPRAKLVRGVYRLTFHTSAYWRRQGKKAFYPKVPVIFEIQSAGRHTHVPLLLNPFGYSTYRGS